jgi:hypothetical protein
VARGVALEDLDDVAALAVEKVGDLPRPTLERDDEAFPVELER